MLGQKTDRLGCHEPARATDLVDIQGYPMSRESPKLARDAGFFPGQARGLNVGVARERSVGVRALHHPYIPAWMIFLPVRGLAHRQARAHVGIG
jgi:hypothetical protein